MKLYIMKLFIALLLTLCPVLSYSYGLTRFEKGNLDKYPCEQQEFLLLRQAELIKKNRYNNKVILGGFLLSSAVIPIMLPIKPTHKKNALIIGAFVLAYLAFNEYFKVQSNKLAISKQNSAQPALAYYASAQEGLLISYIHSKLIIKFARNNNISTTLPPFPPTQ